MKRDRKESVSLDKGVVGKEGKEKKETEDTLTQSMKKESKNTIKERKKEREYQGKKERGNIKENKTMNVIKQESKKQRLSWLMSADE